MNMKRHRSAPLRTQLVSDLKGYLSANDCPSGQLPCELELASRFQVSRKTLRAALDVLEDENLIKRIHGKGTFRTNILRHQLQKIIYHMIPCADYTIRADMNSRNGIDKLQAGLLRASAEMDCRVVCVPFSRTNNQTDVDYEALDMIEPGAKVFLPGMWYRHSFRFLHERNCDVAFLYTQNFSMHFPDDDNYTPYIKDWHQMQQDTGTVTEEGVRELLRRGCRRPILCAAHLSHVTNMRLSGYLQGGGKLYWDVPSDLSGFEVFKKELWKKYRESDFDGLLLGCLYEFEPDYRYSLQRNLGLPEDIEIITMNEYDFCRRMYPKLSCMTYDFQQICRDAVDILWHGSAMEKRIYHAILQNYE